MAEGERLFGEGFSAVAGQGCATSRPPLAAISAMQSHIACPRLLPMCAMPFKVNADRRHHTLLRALRHRAIRYRAIAPRLNDARTIQALHDLAAEYEARADRIEAQRRADESGE